MKTVKTLATFALAVSAIASASVIVLSSATVTNGDPLTVSGPEALRDELHRVQAATLPVPEPVTLDMGWRLYTGDGGVEAAALAAALLPAESPDGGTGWPVTLREDPWTRATVFLNADGDPVGWLPPPEGYDPGWALAAGLPAGTGPGAFDPASVSATFWLDLAPPHAFLQGYVPRGGDAGDGGARKKREASSGTTGAGRRSEGDPGSAAARSASAVPVPGTPPATGSATNGMTEAEGSRAAVGGSVPQRGLEGVAADGRTVTLASPGRRGGDIDIRGKNVRIRVTGGADRSTFTSGSVRSRGTEPDAHSPTGGVARAGSGR